MAFILVVGGHENKDGKVEKKVQEGNCNPREILETFIRLTGKKSPVIEVVTSASSDGKESFKDYDQALSELGLKQVGHIHHDKGRKHWVMICLTGLARLMGFSFWRRSAETHVHICRYTFLGTAQATIYL
jgi:hypothetical protein